MESFLKSSKEESILEKLERFKEEAIKFNKNFEESKTEQERFYDGEHWKDYSPSNRPKNHVFQIVESEIPLLMDPMPATAVLAHDEENFGDHAIVLEAAKKHVYRQQNVFLRDVIAIRAMLKTGVGYQYIDYDPDGENGEGSVTVENKNRKFVFKDPTTDDIDKARFVIVESPISKDDLKRRFPKTCDEALNQSIKDLFLFAGRKGRREHQNVLVSQGKSINRYDSEDMTFIEDCWVKDYTLEKIPEDETQIQLTEESAQLMQGLNPDISKWEDHEAHLQGHGEQKDIILQEALATMGISPEMATQADIDQLKQDPEISLRLSIIDDHMQMHQMYIESLDPDEVGKRNKYPNNLRLIIKTGSVIHSDGAPNVPDGLIPLVEFECYKDEGPAEGIVKNIVPMQKTVNELDEKELRGLKLVANPGWMKDENSGVDEDTLTDEDGIVVTKAVGSEVQRLPAGTVSGQLEQRSRREYEAMNRIEGTGETVFGEAPKGDPSGALVRRLQQQALGRIRLKSHMISSAIYRRDVLITSRIMKNWSTERKLRSEDANGRIKFIKFDPRMMKDFTYELSFPQASSLDNDPEVIQGTYKEMLGNGQIDLKTFAQLTNIPKKQDLLRILAEKDEVAQQTQQLQAQNEELQKQMLMLKYNTAPSLLTKQELQMVEQLIIMAQNEAATQAPMAVE